MSKLERLKKLEKEVQSKLKIIVCWCDVEESEQHKPGCKTADPGPNTKAIIVRYNRSVPIPLDDFIST